MRTRPLVVGIGCRDRGDDGAGPAVAARVVGRLPGVDVVEEASPGDLLDLWCDREVVVVVDAVCTGSVPGSMTILGVDDDPEPPLVWSAGGTHALGLAEAIALGRALDRMPARLVIVGVEAGQFTVGASPSPPVQAALPRAADVVVRILDRRDEAARRALAEVCTDATGG